MPPTEVKPREGIVIGGAEENDLCERVFDKINVGLAVYSKDGALLRINDRLCGLVGYSAEDLSGSHLSRLVDASDKKSVCEKTDALLRGETDSFAATVRLARKDGAALPVQATYAVGLNAAGRPDFITLAVLDASPATSLAARQKVLVQELSHRTKNILTIVQVLARQIGRHANTAEEFEAQFAPRLAAIAASHDVIAASGWTGVDLAAVVQKQLRLFAQATKTKIRLTGPPLLVRPSAAQNIGMAIHELAGNSCKFGSLSNGPGSVDIAWNADDNVTFQMTWTESGGPPVQAPARSGFGLVVAKEMVAYALNGEVDYVFDRDGVKWRLAAPLSSVAGDVRSQRAKGD